MSESIYKNTLLLFAATVFVVIFYSASQVFNVENIEHPEPVALELPTGIYQEHIVHESANALDGIILNGHKVSDDEFLELLQKYEEHSSPENRSLEELEGGKISIISYYWNENPTTLLAKVRVIKEIPSVGFQIDCFVQQCII